MKNKIAVILIIVMSLTITSCANSQEKYISLDSNETINNDESKTLYKGDYRTNYPLNAELYTYDGSCVFNYAMKADLDKEIIYHNCDIIGCKHNDFDCEAYEKAKRNSLRSYDGGFYYAVENEVYYEKDGKSTLINKNDFSTDFAKETYALPTEIYSIFILDNGNLLAGGCNFFYIIDPNKKEASEPIEVGDITTTSTAIIDSNMAIITNINQEMLLVNFDTMDVKKIEDHARDAQVLDDKIYYLTWRDDISILKRCDINGENSEELVKDCYLFSIVDGNIFYVEFDKDDILYKYEPNSEKVSEFLNLEDVEGQSLSINPPFHFTDTDFMVIRVSNPIKSGSEYYCIDLDGTNPRYIELSI
ncbi:MAG: DUF5050 domain-containing protein [Clostridiales bacterium]|nr:DUF5050 domain-containing protein [Clostridiales bacterium]